MINLRTVFNILIVITWPLVCNDPPLLWWLTCKFDFIVVGGGSAGSVIASRLSENPNVKVLLLEAGGCPPLLTYIPGLSPSAVGSSVDWQYVIQPQVNSFDLYPNNQIRYIRGKMLGGTSQINAMIYCRGNPDDYDGWETMGNPGWGWKDVLPLFKLSEGNMIPDQASDLTYHNTSGPLKVSLSSYSTLASEAFLKSGQLSGLAITDINGVNQSGVSKTPFTMVNGVRCSTFVAYLEPAMKRSNLVVITNAFVTKIKLNDKKQAIGVQYESNGEQKDVFASKEVILSAGVFGSPHLLLLSGIGPADVLQKHNITVVADLPGVGQNLQDHVGCLPLIWKLNCTDCTFTFNKMISPISLTNYTLQRKGPLTIFGANEGMAFFKSGLVNASSNKPDIEIVLFTINPATVPDSFTASGVSQEVLMQYYGPLANESAFIIFVQNYDTKSRGFLTLNSSDPFQRPLIDFRYFSDETDMAVLLDGMKKTIKLVNSQPFQSLGAQLNPTIMSGCENLTQFSDDYLECMCRRFSYSTFHAAGTCKMGLSSDPWSVVNSALEVHKVGNLRCADASVMPKLVTGNTNAPAIMIAENAAKFIKSKYNI